MSSERLIYVQFKSRIQGGTYFYKSKTKLFKVSNGKRLIT